MTMLCKMILLMLMLSSVVERSVIGDGRDDSSCNNRTNTFNRCKVAACVSWKIRSRCFSIAVILSSRAQSSW